MIFKVRRCAEPMTQLCRLIVKVMVGGHGIFSWFLCLLHIALSQEGFSLNFATCATKVAALEDWFFLEQLNAEKTYNILYVCPDNSCSNKH